MTSMQETKACLPNILTLYMGPLISLPGLTKVEKRTLSHILLHKEELHDLS